MNSVELIRRMHQHRAWVNQQILTAAGELNQHQLQQEFAIGQGSIWRTLLHLFAAEYVWLEALQGETDPLTPGDLPGKLPGNQQGTDSVTSLAELYTRWQSLQERWDDYLDQLQQQELSELVGKISTSSGAGKIHYTHRSDILIHVCTHAQYTVAQLVNMLRQSGVTSFPDVMMITLARQTFEDSSG